MVDATNNDVCETLDCELIVLNRAGLSRTVADEKAEKLTDKTPVDGNKKVDWEERLLNSSKLCDMVDGEDADILGDTGIVDGNAGCNGSVGEALADNKLDDVAIVKTADSVKEVANVFTVEEETEYNVEIAEKSKEESGVEVASDCTVKVVEGVIGNEEAARVVESAIIDRAAIIEGDAGTTFCETAISEDEAKIVDKTVAVEDGAGTALEERLSALMMSAAFERVSGLY